MRRHTTLSAVRTEGARKPGTARSVLDGFDSINLDPSPGLRRQLRREQREPHAFIVVWRDVAEVLERAARRVVPAGNRR